MKKAAEFSRIEKRKRGIFTPVTTLVSSSGMCVCVSLMETLNIGSVRDADVYP